jgi:hypothetical protein
MDVPQNAETVPAKPANEPAVPKDQPGDSSRVKDIPK